MAELGKSSVAVIAGIFLILGAIMGAYLDFLLGVRLQTESQIRQQRLQAYSDYLITRDQMRPILEKMNLQEELKAADREIIAASLHARYRLAIYASPDVIAAVTSFIRDQNSDTFSALLRAMRLEEFSNKEIKTRDVLAIICPHRGSCFGKTDNEHLNP